MRRAAAVLSFVVLCSAACAPVSSPIRQASNVPPTAIQQIAGDLQWSDAPPSLPAGTKLQILEGSPQQAQMFTIRLLIPAGTVVQPHTHPREERVTILSGEIAVGFGDSVDRDDLTLFPTGSFYVNPPGVPHYLIIRRDSVLQLTGMGPWELNYVAR